MSHLPIDAEAQSRRGPVGYLELLRGNVDYRRLWLAEVISFLGDWFNTIALFTAVARLSGSTEAVAAVFVAKMLPIFAMTPVAGPLIDRLDRRKLLIGTDVARALCAVGLIAAYRMQSVGLLLAVLVVMMCFAGVFIPAKTAVLPQITTTSQLGAANALSSGTWSVMLAVGAASGGLVTGLVGIPMALAIDAFTFVLSAVVLLPLPALRPTDASGRVSPTRERGFVAGLRYLRGRPYLAAVISLKSCLALAGGSLAMLPVFGTRVFADASGAQYIGWLYTARGLGALVGSLLVRRLFGDAPRTMRRFIAPALLLCVAGHSSLACADTITQAGVAYFATAVGGGTVWVYSGTLGQLASANEYRGRVFAVEWGLMTLVTSATAAGAGGLVDRAGWSVREVALASGLVLLLPVAAWLALLTYLRLGLARHMEQPGTGPPSEGAAQQLHRYHAHWRQRWLGELPPPGP